MERIEELLTGMRTVTDSIAHDLRSPLTRMKGALARALEPGATEAERLDAIDAAHDEADRALATLSALLDIARAETGLSREMMQMIDVAALVEELVDFFTPVIEDAGQHLEIVVPPAPVVVRAHPALLRQAIGNLLHNAAHYAGAGAVVRVSVEEDDDSGVRLTVADTGVGVPENQRGRVQQRFVRLDPARGVGGSGLGLAIVAACANYCARPSGPAPPGDRQPVAQRRPLRRRRRLGARLGRGGLCDRALDRRRHRRRRA